MIPTGLPRLVDFADLDPVNSSPGSLLSPAQDVDEFAKEAAALAATGFNRGLDALYLGSRRPRRGGAPPDPAAVATTGRSTGPASTSQLQTERSARTLLQQQQDWKDQVRARHKAEFEMTMRSNMQNRVSMA